jgi:flagellar basal body-associated protein FliL
MNQESGAQRPKRTNLVIYSIVILLLIAGSFHYFFTTSRGEPGPSDSTKNEKVEQSAVKEASSSVLEFVCFFKFSGVSKVSTLP